MYSFSTYYIKGELMNTKQIAIKYFAPKLEDPKMIFKNLDIFKSVLFWARDSAREFFSTQPSKMFLAYYIDDIAPIVDEYLICRVEKMYQKALQEKNNLSYNLNSSEKIIEWIINRYINTCISLTTNNNYKDYIDIRRIKQSFDDILDSYSSNIDNVIEFERLKRLPKKRLKEALKDVWKDAIYDSDFDIDNFEYLCNEFNLKSKSILKKGYLVKLNLKKVQTKNGNAQLVLVF